MIQQKIGTWSDSEAATTEWVIKKVAQPTKPRLLQNQEPSSRIFVLGFLFFIDIFFWSWKWTHQGVGNNRNQELTTKIVWAQREFHTTIPAKHGLGRSCGVDPLFEAELLCLRGLDGKIPFGWFLLAKKISPCVFPQQQNFAMGSLAQISSGALQHPVPDKVPEGSGADTSWCSGRFRCKYLVRFQRVPVRLRMVLCGSGSFLCKYLVRFRRVTVQILD